MDWERLGRIVNAILDRVYGEGTLTPEQKVVYLAYFMDAEVHNGGFDQFFFNSQGNHARETLDALRALGAPTSAKLLKKACEAFAPEEPSPDRDLRWVQMDRIPKPLREGWNALDDLYYKCGESVPALCDAYIQARPTAFPE